LELSSLLSSERSRFLLSRIANSHLRRNHLLPSGSNQFVSNMVSDLDTGEILAFFIFLMTVIVAENTGDLSFGVFTAHPGQLSLGLRIIVGVG
jgi:hypothetical protein